MKESKATFLLFLASFLWGMTFVFQNQAASVIEPGIFNGIRMFIGFIVLLPLFTKIIKRHQKNKTYLKKLNLTGAGLGAIIALASYTQQMGIGMTSTGKASFITSLYVLLVPVFALFFGKKTNGKTWGCVAIGLCGAFLLSIKKESGISFGDGLIFLCAILFAIQIIVIDVFGKEFEGVDLSALQFFFGSLFSFIIALFTKEEINFNVVKLAIVPILYAGIFSCGVAYTLQIVGQKYMHPTKATLILCLESVWGALGGAVFLKERMNLKELCGCLLLFTAVVLSQIPDRKKKEIK